MDVGHGPCIAVFQLLCNSGQRKKIVILRLGLVLLERLASAAHHVIFTAVFQHIVQCVRLMLMGHQPGVKGKMRGFHGSVAMIYTDDDGFAHLASPP